MSAMVPLDTKAEVFALQMQLFRSRSREERLECGRQLSLSLQRAAVACSRDAREPLDAFGAAARIGADLHARNIPYVVTGGVAVCCYGEPRSTLNLDMLIDESVEPEVGAYPELRFVRTADAFWFARQCGVAVDGVVVSFAAPEAVVISKLIGRLYDQKWRDVIGILRISRNHLDDTYLDRAAASFNVTDLLARARADAASL